MNPNWKASWIWHQDDPQKKNIYVHFRKAFQIPSRPDEAIIHITADTEYMLWVNGVDIGRGPVLSDPRWQPYDTHDIAQFLQAGENIIAVLCYYYGEGLEDDSWRKHRVDAPLNMKRAAHDSRPGLLCQAEITISGRQVNVVSDSSWRSLVSSCWLCDVRKIDDQTYSEVYFAQHEPGSWLQADYDDSTWNSVKILWGFLDDSFARLGRAHTHIFPWVILEPSDQPPMTHRELLPAEVVTTGEVIETGDYGMGATALQMALEHILPPQFTTIHNPEAMTTGRPVEIEPFDHDIDYYHFRGVRSTTVILDMGDLINGRIHIDLEGPCGSRVDIAYGQRLLENGKPETYSSRICSADTYVMKAGRQQWTSFGWRHFRFVQLTFRDLPTPLTIHGIKAVADEYPAEQIGDFQCSDETVNWLWRASVKTTRLCTYDRFMDCARERRQHAEYPIALCTMSSFGDTAILRRFFRTFLRDQTPYGFIPNSSPSEYENAPLIGSSTMLIDAIWKHYGLYADKTLLKEAYDAQLRYIQFIDNFRGDDGLIDDHPMMVWQDDPAVDGNGKGKLLTINAMYARDLELAAIMAAEFGNPDIAAGFEQQFSETRDAINKKLWDDQQGGFVDYISSEDTCCEHVSEHGNYMMMSYGYVSKERAARIVDLLKEPDDPSKGRVSPAFMTYVMEGLFRYGYASEAIHIARHVYDRLIRQGYETVSEYWNLNGFQTWLGGWQPFASRAIAHGGAVGTTYSLAAYVLGVTSASPGCKDIEIAPQTGDLAWAKGAVPTAKGIVSVGWQIAEGVFRLSCDLPQQMTGRVVLPSAITQTEQITVNGAKPTFVRHSNKDVIYVSGQSVVESPCQYNKKKRH